MSENSSSDKRDVAFVAAYDPTDPSAWSGIPARMLSGLRLAGLPVRAVGPLRLRGNLLWRFERRARRVIGASTLLREREPWIADSYGRQVARLLRTDPPIAVISPGTVAVARLNCTAPVVIWADATFAGMRGYYGGFTGLARRTVAAGETLERQALHRCAAAVFSSNWAARSAVEYYGVPPERVHEIPFGANLDPEFNDAEVESLVMNRQHETCELLFVGVDWQRKGADLAIKVVTLLNRRGLRSRLTIVGCEPPSGVRVPDCVRVLGFTPRGNARSGGLSDLFATAHFFILPTRAEAFGIVFAEASAFAVPSLATRTGGVESAVREGANGWLFDLEDGPERYCSVVESLMADRQAYVVAALRAHREYAHRLNWRSSCHDVAEVIRRAGAEQMGSPK
jgi:glycosyltransferase involved in cell wall biosynthesis